MTGPAFRTVALPRKRVSPLSVMQRSAPVTHDSMMGDRVDSQFSAQAIEAVIEATRTHREVGL